MPALSYTLVLSLLTLSLFSRTYARALTLSSRQGATPTFPSDPPSCPICEQSYANINSCAAAAPVLANVSMILFNPGAFIDVIECACTDTFQAAYPQCVDCFTKTNQTSFLSAPADSLPSVLSGIRDICALESTLLGNASNVDGETTPSQSVTAAIPTGSASAAMKRRSVGWTEGTLSMSDMAILAVAGVGAMTLAL